MGQILPFVPSVESYGFTTQLGDTQLGFDVSWNERDSAWYMDVFTDDGDLLRSSLKIVLGTLIGRREVDPRWPRGVLVAIDSTKQGLDAGFDDLGTRVQVMFFTTEEFLS